MAGDPQKTPMVQTLNAFTGQKIYEAIERLGQGLPCHVTAVAGQIVTVAFDITENGVTLPSVTIPIATSVYDWMPLQIGDLGMTEAATVRLGGVSGQGGGVADLSQPGNLTALVFVPVSNAAWTAPNANQRVVQGPAGVLLRTTDGSASVNITESAVTITVGSNVWTFNGSGFTMSNAVVAETHVHGGVQTGGGDTGGPING